MLNVKSGKHSPKLNLCRYQSVGDYLGHGSHISMSDSEIRCKQQWTRYKNAMKDLLTDPKTAPWLGGPIDLDWSDSRYYRLCERDRKEGDGATCVSNLKRSPHGRGWNCPLLDSTHHFGVGISSFEKHVWV